MKTLNDISVGDIFYFCISGDTNIKEVVLTSSITKKNKNLIEFYIDHEKLESDQNKTYLLLDKGHRKYYYFVNKTDAIRYAKAQTIKELFRLIDDAKKAINRVKDFRLNHWEDLNEKYTERHIILLEKELKY